DGSPRIGLGLWNHRWAAVGTELLVLLAGGAVYLRATRAKSRGAAFGTGAFAAALVLTTIATPLMPDPPSDRAFAIQALVLYAALAALAEWVDRSRESRAV